MAAFRKIVVFAGVFVGTSHPSAATADQGGVYQAIWQLADVNTDLKIVPAATFLDLGTPPKVYESRLVPESLYVADQELKAVGGAVLFKAGMQLIGMEHAQKLVCSLQPGAADTLSAKNRVCIIDDNADGVFDRYFTRVLGRDFFSSDALWFVMNAKIPGAMNKLGPETFSASKIDSRLYFENISFSLSDVSISSDGSRMSMAANIARKSWLTYRCKISTDDKTAPSDGDCSPPGFTVRYFTSNSGEKFISVKKDSSAINLRFLVRFGIISGKVLEGAVLYAPAVRTTS